MEDKIRIGITHGDINGIGYEVIMKALMDKRMIELCTPIIYGSPKVAAYYKKNYDFENISFNQIAQAEQANSRRINILDCFADELRVEPGVSTQIAGKAALVALEQAVSDLKSGSIDALVTAPINKDNVQSEAFNFPGHTEFLKARFDANEVLMILLHNNLRVGVVTGHVPVKDISRYITKALVFEKIKILNQSLRTDFGIRKPRIAILGLNPHAGDNGLIGTEEIEQIIPAIEMANQKGMLAVGPFAADGFFGSHEYEKFDAVLSMFHDQGLAPFKALAFDQGVNYTAGLSIIRTSPGHGTGYSIVGQNIASEDSMRNAIYLAIDTFRKRSEFQKLNSNPLNK